LVLQTLDTVHSFFFSTLPRRPII